VPVRGVDIGQQMYGIAISVLKRCIEAAVGLREAKHKRFGLHPSMNAIAIWPWGTANGSLFF
jgi:hypothetical protein